MVEALADPNPERYGAAHAHTVAECIGDANFDAVIDSYPVANRIGSKCASSALAKTIRKLAQPVRCSDYLSNLCIEC